MEKMKDRINDFKKNGYSIKIFTRETEVYFYKPEEFDCDYFRNDLWVMHVDKQGNHKFINLKHAQSIDFVK